MIASSWGIAHEQDASNSGGPQPSRSFSYRKGGVEIAGRERYAHGSHRLQP